MTKSKRDKIKQKIDEKKKRLEDYRRREHDMLTDGAQSYGIGSRNVTRYNTDLATVRAAIEDLEDEIEQLEETLEGGSARKAVGIVPRDW